MLILGGPPSHPASMIAIPTARSPIARTVRTRDTDRIMPRGSANTGCAGRTGEAEGTSRVRLPTCVHPHVVRRSARSAKVGRAHADVPRRQFLLEERVTA